jgi:Zn-dependent protease
MTDINNIILQVIIYAPPILFAVTIHEFSHGWVADRLGDPTARLAGRLTLNPIKHLDLVGTLVFVITRMIGWAKPVPVNPYNLKDPRRDMLWVSLAGPGSNLLVALGSAAVFHLLKGTMLSESTGAALITKPLFSMTLISIMINVALAIFNLIPIPPLDGSKILMGLLPPAQAASYAKLEPYGFIILILLIMTNSFEFFLFPLIRGAISIFLGGS